MSVEDLTVDGVVLRYRLTAADYKEALIARTKGSASARRSRRLSIVSCVLGVFFVALLAVTDSEIPVPLLVIPVAFALLQWGTPRLQSRQFGKLAQAHGDYRTTVTESDVTVAHQQATGTMTWQAAPRYVETSRLFVLLSGDKNATCLTILPKRAVQDEATVERLRALLDRHRTRL
ncbi:YcxB family protein [Streptomyces sp. NPDC006530]|uniref:YcxB family protein n=1 Tax=Streptomyces sp. NPDC006530 TaxID=3364750 RepID=UPI0036AB2CE9